MKKIRSRLVHFTRSFLKDERGALYIFLAGLLPLFLVIIVFALDFGFAYGRKGGMQAAADAAAMAGAMQIAFDNPSGLPSGSAPYSAIMTRAMSQSYASLNYAGYTNGFTDSFRSVTVDTPTIDNSIAPFTVGVAIKETRIFGFLEVTSKLIGKDYSSTVIAASAKARAINAGDYCIISRALAGAGAVSTNGTVDLGTPNGCGIAVNSNDKCALDTRGTSTNIAAPVNLVGGSCNTGNPPPISFSYGYPVPDPYEQNGTKSALVNYANSATTSRSANPTCSGGTCILSPPPPGTVLNGNRILSGSNNTLTLSPGVYVFNDLILRNTEKLNATGPVTVIVKGGNFQAIGNEGVELQAPTQGPYSGIAVACILNCTSVTFRGGPSFAGAIYAPSVPTTYSGNAASSCIQLVSDTIQLSGSVTLNDNCPQVTTRSSRYVVRLTE